MREAPGDVWISVVANRLGAPVDIADVDDPGIAHHLDELREQGFRRLRIADATTADFALAVTPGAPGGPAPSEPFDTIVVCSDSIGDTPPSDWSRDYQRAAGLDGVQALFVSGSSCANLALGFDVARGLVATGKADAVLVVTADQAPPGGRYTGLTRSAYSDAAASCLVSRRPAAPGFRLLGTGTEVVRVPDAPASELAQARSTMLAMNRATTRAVGEQPVDAFAHVSTLNLGVQARRLLAMATRLPDDRLLPGRVSEIGHCYAADVALNLEHAHETGALVDGDRVLALASSVHALSAVALEYHA